MEQLDLFTQIETTTAAERKAECTHESGFITNSEVPAAIYCDDCDKIIMRMMPAPADQPFQIGYISADWAWKYKHDRAWTSDYEYDR